MNIDVLLQEREKYQRQIDSATKGYEAVNVLLALQGYSDSNNKIVHAVIASSVPSIAGKQEKRSTDSLRYADLAREWAESVTGEVTIMDFYKWIEAKHPSATPNKNSMSGPISRQVIDKKLVLVRQGKGRAPSVYGPALL